MLLFTTTPASAMMPMPVITMPKGWPMIIRPRKTPIVDMMTAEKISPTEMKLLNCARSTRKIRNSAAPNALPRKAPAAACSSSSPASFQRMPLLSRSAAASCAAMPWRIGSACTPSRILAWTVTVRRASMRFKVPVVGAGSRVTKFDRGTVPLAVSILSWSSCEMVRWSGGRRSTMSTASSDPAGR